MLVSSRHWLGATFASAGPRDSNLKRIEVTMPHSEFLAQEHIKEICSRALFDSLVAPVTEGARVVVHAKFQYYIPRGSLSLVATEIRPVGTK